MRVKGASSVDDTEVCCDAFMPVYSDGLLHAVQVRRRRMKFFRRKAVAAAMLLCGSWLGGCRVSEDAVAASEQMTTTAAALERYYGQLIAAETDSIALLEVDSAVSGIRFNEADRKLPDDTRAELLKRKAMADSLAVLASSLQALTGSTAAANVQSSATALGNALVDAKALPQGSPIPDSLGKAGRLLIQLVQQHEERKAAQAMDGTLAAVAELFGKEKPAYDSIALFHLRQAALVAKDLTTANGVDMTPMLAPALRPFDLTPVPASPQLQGSLRQLALSRLDAKVEAESSREMEASLAMLAALEEMSARVHTLATGHRMAARSEPFSLHTVKEWLDLSS